MKVVSHLVANKVLRYLSSIKGFIHQNKSLVRMEPKKKKTIKENSTVNSRPRTLYMMSSTVSKSSAKVTIWKEKKENIEVLTGAEIITGYRFFSWK